MKCQQCERPATYHITELTGDKPIEVHLCEKHAREYLNQKSGPAESSAAAAVEGMAQHIVKQMAVGQAAEEMQRLDEQTCPYCGISFFKFRNQGRLGCPHDYEAFREQLESLILNIHGETRHTGKVPRRGAEGSRRRSELIRLRREMQEAVKREEYERASEIRDRIREIEQEG
ncbi:MAG: DNA helicase UvrBC [Planctomycetota bacterium]|nr:MAG: DNA helicase UvrBC [Planctomycetota bacterium]